MLTKSFIFAFGISFGAAAAAQTATIFLLDHSNQVAQSLAPEAKGHFVFNPRANCEITLDLYGIQKSPKNNGRSVQLACSSVCDGNMQIGENTFINLTESGRFSYECGEQLSLTGQVRERL